MPLILPGPAGHQTWPAGPVAAPTCSTCSWCCWSA